MIHFKEINLKFEFKDNLYELGKKTNFRVLINEEPTHTLSVPVHFANDTIRQYIALSFVFVFKNKTEIYLGMLRVTKTDLLLFLYLTTESILTERCLRFQEKFTVMLDLDKTLIISDVDVTRGHDKFVTHLFIDSYKVIDNLPFKTHVMIRPDAHIFLKRLFEIANVYIITASDLHYAEEIVYAANRIGWGGDVYFPDSNVYSTRNEPTKALLKTFDFIVPEMPAKIIAVDDNLAAWEPSSRQHVLQIKPFEPDEEPGELIKMLQVIEKIL